MFSSIMYLLLCAILFIFTPESCTAEVTPSALYLYSPGDLEYLDVIVKRSGDNLTLACELRDGAAALMLWNFVAAELQPQLIKPFEIKKNGTFSSLIKDDLTVADSGRYICTSPPYSATKYILVQDSVGVRPCARGAFACELRCVLPGSVCDGRADCLHAEDEDEAVCGVRPCSRPDRLNCSSGACIPAAACCARASALCSEHDCCRDHRHTLHSRFQNMELLPPVEDRHAPDDYGFIQSTIYTVTACALIFMIAVVLLVSAICKMHMKRAALRSYADARQHCGPLYAQRHRFPPCYEASDLLEQAALAPPSPMRETQCVEDTSPSSPVGDRRSTRLSALASVFSSRYRQVPTQLAEVEMTSVGAGPSSYCESALDDRHRLTLQLGRFHLSIPSFRRASEPRPDTPNVAEISLEDIDFVRLNTSDTYTLNGRTIRLLGGNFENYPMLGGSNPPPYNEAMRFKLYGPPPEYLSRDMLNRTNSVDDQARSNVEMPPGYEEVSDNQGNGNNSEISELPSPTLDEATNGPALGSISNSNGNLSTHGNTNGNTSANVSNITITYGNIISNNGNDNYNNCETINSVIDNLPAIDSDVNANDEIFANNNNLVA